MSEADGGIVPIDLWHYKETGTTDDGGNELKAMFGRAVFDNPKPTSLIQRCLQLDPQNGDSTLILDFFAGSGTTGHAVISLNRSDGGTRRYLLVEMGDYFVDIVVPRIKKAIFCSGWKDGKPTSSDGTSQTVKYHLLEQYEDTLNNLELPRNADGSQALDLFGDDYLLRYMLDFETQGSASLLNVTSLVEPFAYQLKIRQGDENPEKTVDLVETFNYLLGLTVKRMRQFDNEGRLYRVVIGDKDGKTVAVVWRDSKDLADNEAALTKDRQFITETIFPALLPVGTTPDRLLVNSPFSVSNAEAIEPVFQQLMFAGVA